MSDNAMRSTITELPPLGIEIAVNGVLMGRAAMYDLRHPSGCPYVRVDRDGSSYIWLRVAECDWEGRAR